MLVALAAAAWIVTALRMAGMDDGPGTNPGAVGFFLGSWAVMMAAMMLPAVAPVVLAYRGFQRKRFEDRAPAPVADAALLLVGYFAVWVAAGLLGYALLEAGRAVAGDLLAWDRAGRFTAAGVLGAAALYQLTPSKDACLRRCRAGQAFPRARAQGPAAALRAGLEHGVWCLGCCWALMAALFALGAMSVWWMALISLLIAAERLWPRPAAASGGVASLLVVIAIAVAAAPTRVPMLTIPHSGSAMEAPMGQVQATPASAPARLGGSVGARRSARRRGAA